MILKTFLLFHFGKCSWEEFDFSFTDRDNLEFFEEIKSVDFPTVGDIENSPPVINLANQNCK